MVPRPKRPKRISASVMTRAYIDALERYASDAEKFVTDRVWDKTNHDVVPHYRAVLADVLKK